MGSLSLFSTFQSETIDHFVAQFSTSCNETHKISELENYVVRLQDEMKKIDAFKRDLPLIISLLNEAIVKYKLVLSKCKKSKDPVLEEFIPLKSTKTDESFDEKKEKDVITSTDKKNWMSSVQLWHSNDQKPCPDNKDLKKSEDIKWPMGDLFPSGEKKVTEKGFEPYKGCSSVPVIIVGKEEKNEVPIVPRLSLSPPEIIKISIEGMNYNGLSSNPSSSRSGSSSATNSQSQNARKQRRCWSPELHRRFINALQQLGGAQVATPKQIRELMQVDGLTNDEVKSHLQKYRLHTRKAITATNSSTTHPLGLWVAQEQCGESSKPSNSQSGSPPGPLHLVGSSMGTSMITDSMEEEDDESHSWKSHNH